MKKNRKSFRTISRLAFGIFLAFVVFAVFTNSLILLSSDLKSSPTNFPSNYSLGLLFDYVHNADNGTKMLRQLFGNLIAYIIMGGGLVLFILSLALVKGCKKAKWKCAFLSLGLILPAMFGFISGIIDFFAQGYTVLSYFGNLQTSLIFAGVTTTLIFGCLYIAFTIITFIKGVKLKKEDCCCCSEEQAQPQQVSQEAEEEKRQQLLDDVREIVREELNKLDRIVIAREVKVAPRQQEVKPEPKPEPKPEVKPEPKPEPKKEEPKPEPAPAPAPAEEEGESSGSIQRVPFADKITKAEQDLQDKYNELKSEVLAYGTNSRVSVACDTFRLHRKAYVKITVMGKMLKVYYALDPKEFADSTVPIVDVSGKVAYADTPSMLKVKSNLSFKRAKELIEQVFARDNIQKEKEPEKHDWVKEISQDEE